MKINEINNVKNKSSMNNFLSDDFFFDISWKLFEEWSLIYGKFHHKPNFEIKIKKFWGKSQAPQIKNIQLELEHVSNLLKKDCSKYLPIICKTPLYRGIGNLEFLVGVNYSLTKRIPKDSDIKETKKFNKILKLLGYKINRSNSIFTTGNVNFASAYGNVHIKL
jgi:hypothetical protein